MPGFLIVLTPLIGWSWPALSPILMSTAAALGYGAATSAPNKSQFLTGKLTRQLNAIKRVSISLDSMLTDVIAEDLGSEERVEFRKGDFLLVFRKDARGKFHVDVSGPSDQTARALREKGEEFASEVIRRFAYHKVVEQIERRGATIVEEEKLPDGSIRLHNRQWK